MKRTITYLLLITILLCCSCKSKKQVLDKPDDLISRSTLTEIIAESYVIESTIHLAPDSLNKRDLAQQYYKELFDKYHITRQQFESSINYYIADETTAERLLTDASKNIEKKRMHYKDELDAYIKDKQANGQPGDSLESQNLGNNPIRGPQ